MLKNIWIYRSPYGFMPSWNVRERERGQGHWPAGQIGLFGLLELLVCIDNCLSLKKDVFIFPYESGLLRSAHVTLEALDFLEADAGLYDRESFETKQHRRIDKRLRRNPEHSGCHALREYEEEILHVLQVRQLDSIIDQGRGVMVSELATSLRDFLAGVAGVLPQALDRAFMACDVPAVTSFGREYYKRFGPDLKALLTLAGDSMMLASFQRFGIYENLRMYSGRLKRLFANARTTFSISL
jgi:hypothetical protein